MAIDTEALYTQKYKEHNTTAASTEFLRDFIYSLNRTLLRMLAKIGVEATPPIDADDDIDLDDYYLEVISAGVDYYLWLTGRWSNKDFNILSAMWEQSLREGHGYYMNNTVHQSRIGTVSTDTEDE